MSQFNKAEALKLLNDHSPFDAAEISLQQKFINFIEGCDAQTASSEAGRLSAATWVTDIAAKKVLLLHNPVLKIWLNPGGKYEPADLSVRATASRELREEAGLDVPAAALKLFDIDVITLDYNPHLKTPLYDMRFTIDLDSDMPLPPTREIEQMSWHNLDELKQKLPDDIRNYRLLRRTEILFAG